MKRILTTLAVVAAFTTAWASKQYDIDTNAPAGQNWKAAQEIRLTFTEGGSFWMANYISNWSSIADLGSVADMSKGSYGAVDSSGNKISGTGATTDLTFTNDKGKSITTKGYYLGDFEIGDTISIWITNNGDAIGYSTGRIGEGDNADLISRLFSQTDQADNTRFNFGFNNGTVEFIIVKQGQAMGQPLPGVIASVIIGLGACGGMLAMKIRKNHQMAA